MGALKLAEQSFDISKMEVWEAYRQVRANRGAPGVDGLTLGEFEADLKNNLFKICNRMSSGSYFPPPVKAVQIAKAHGTGTRTLGVPTVADRVAQTVVANRLGEKVEPIFHPDSYTILADARGCSPEQFGSTFADFFGRRVGRLSRAGGASASDMPFICGPGLRTSAVSRRLIACVVVATYSGAMTTHPEVFDAALTLPDAERAELAHRLLVSLDGPADDAALVEAEWASEIANRMARIEAGATRGIPWDEVRGHFGR